MLDFPLPLPIFLSRLKHLPVCADTDVPDDVLEQCRALCERNVKVHCHLPRVLHVCCVMLRADQTSDQNC
jgi:hypothetical protein